MSGGVERYIGVDVGGTKILGVLVTEDGEIVGRFKQATATGGAPLADQVGGAVRGLLKQADLAAEDARGIGIAAPGVVDSQTGQFVIAPNLEIDDPRLVDRVREQFGVPCAIGNDVNLGTLAEVWLGAGRGTTSVVGIFVGTGIGGGVVMDGRLRTGVEDLAGEIGHMILMVGGPKCGCGALGCFEAVASRTAIERDIRQAIAEGRESQIAESAKRGRIKSGALSSALAAGDEVVTEVLTRTGHYLAQGILTIRHLIDPELVILGGGVMEACGDFLMPIVEAGVRADTMRGSRDVMRVVPSQLGDDAVALGAAALVRGEVTGRAFGEGDSEQAEAQPTKPHIDGAKFGHVVVNGEKLPHDIFILASGKLCKRKKKPARKKYGTSHVIDREELEQVCKGEPCAVIIGLGFQEMVRLTDDAKQYLDSLGVPWHGLRTPKAITAYNEAACGTALLLHVTC